MLAILDIKAETRAIRELLEEDDDEEDETDS